ncbi:MAG: hypothetical protein QOF24_832 [Verrucomicrobiota bacterium]|jgi:hypothetical protein
MTRVCLCVLFLGSVAAVWPASSFAAAPVPPRTIRDLADAIAPRVLQRSISPWFYKSLLVSPIDDWVVVRARLAHTRLSGARVIRPALNPKYDAIALQRVNEFQIAGNYSIGEISLTDSVLLHLLIYKIADGTMALSFAYLDGPGGSQMKYFGCARVAVLKSDGRWEEIKGPEGLEGKGWAVRESGVRNSFKMDKVPQHFSSGSPR